MSIVIGVYIKMGDFEAGSICHIVLDVQIKAKRSNLVEFIYLIFLNCRNKSIMAAGNNVVYCFRAH